MTTTSEQTTQRATTARTLTIAAGICVLLGLIVSSPSGAMFGYALAALFALPAVLMARDRARVVAVLVLAATLALAVITYPVFKTHMADYAKHSQKP